LQYLINRLVDFDEILHDDTMPIHPDFTSCSEIQILKLQRWRTAAILKNVKCDISVAVRPILMKFGMTMQTVENFIIITEQVQQADSACRW